MKKTVIRSSAILFFAVVAVFALSLKCEAAAVQKIPEYADRVKVKGNYYWITSENDYEELRRSKTKKGSGICILREPSTRFASAFMSAVTDGQKIYYGSHHYHNYAYPLYGYRNDSNSSGSSDLNTIAPNAAASDKYYLYQCNMDGSSEVYLGSVGSTADIAGYYNGYLYLNVYKNKKNQLYRYNMKTKKKKTIGNNIILKQQYQKYFITSFEKIHSFQIDKEEPESVYGFPLQTYKVYNASSNKFKNLTKKGFLMKQKKNNIYFTELISVSKNKANNILEYKFRIKKYNCIKKKITTLSKPLITTDIYGNRSKLLINDKRMMYQYQETLYNYVYKTKKNSVYRK